jgi:hypothetical protein
MQSGNYSIYVGMAILIVLSVGLAACERNQTGKVAPIGDHAVLEQLANAYRSMEKDYPVRPANMRPKGKKEFVERVFTTAGYHYGATLTAFAKQGADVTSQDQRDLADLLFLPHRGLSEEDMKDLYTSEELAAIRAIQTSLK